MIVKTREVETTEPTLPAAHVPHTPAVIEVPAVEDEHSKVSWDRVAIAPGTVGWFEIGNLPSALAARVGTIQSWSSDYTSIFFRCVKWTESASTVTCTKLAGGNYVETSSFGPAPAVGASNGIGAQLGDGLQTAKVLWTMAQGSLWGYDEVTTPPTPTPVAIGSITGLSYRKGDSAYLAWQYAPGVIVWLAATGYTNAEMAEMAASARPAALPSLPLLIAVGANVTDSNGVSRSLKVTSVNGVRCAGITVYTQCTRIDQGPALVRTLDQAGPAAVGAVVPSGTTASLVVTLVGGQLRTVPLTPAGLGIDTALYTAATGETLASAQVVGAAGAVLQTISLAPDPNQPTVTTVAVTPTSEPAVTPAATSG